jgi:transposase InsO family protein
MDDRLRSLLDENYYNIERHPEALTSVNNLLKLVNRKLQVPVEVVREYLRAQQPTYTRHRPAVKVAVRRNRMLASGIGTAFQADLADVQSLASKRGNRGTRFLLCIIDIFTRQAWVRPLKSKTAQDVRDAMESIWTDREMSPQKPTKPYASITMATDKGKEFLNSTVQQWFQQRGIHHFTLQGDHKAAIVERFQRTLKDRLHRVMSARAEPYKYVDLLPTVVSAYNGSRHSSLPQRMRPVDVKKENEHLVWQHQYRQLPKKRYTRIAPDQLKVGDTVLASISKQPFQKGYRQYWHDEQFRVARIKQGVPNKSYVLVSLRDGVPIEGSFYREQLQKVQ